MKLKALVRGVCALQAQVSLCNVQVRAVSDVIACGIQPIQVFMMHVHCIGLTRSEQLHTWL